MSLKIAIAKILYKFIGFREDPHELFRESGVDPDDHILEIGSTIGFHTFPLAEIADNGKVYAVDISEEAIEHLKKKREKKGSDNIVPICGDAADLKLKNKELDKIVCFDTLHDIEDPKKALNNWLKHLKSGGLFLYRDPEISSDKISEYSNQELSKSDELLDVKVFKKE